MDTQQQNFWQESIEKEAALRFAWYLRYTKNFAKDVAKKKPEVVNENIASAKAFQDNISTRLQKLGSTSAEDSKKSRSASRRSLRRFLSKDGIVQDMRPPSVSTKAILYNGISAHGEGRYAYLKKRRQLAPEEKYEFPILSSNLHGWKITEYIKEPKHSPFGRTCIVRDTFYRNSGIKFA
jgi:hypothetical protein